jgi:hypothetical protein
MKKFTFFSFFICFTFFSFISAYSQVRIAFLPFQNTDGNMALNVYCYKLQDSLAKAFAEKDPTQKYYVVVPTDSIEMILTSLNLDPTNPQYKSDMWKAVKMLNITYVIYGNFKYEAERFLINANIYEVKTKFENPDYAAINIFKSQERIMEAIPIITKNLTPAFIK